MTNYPFACLLSTFSACEALLIQLKTLLNNVEERYFNAFIAEIG